MKRGKFYGVGVGPGDPQLLTYKAIKAIEECEILAIPVSDQSLSMPLLKSQCSEELRERYQKQCAAYQILEAATEIAEIPLKMVDAKEKLYLPMPMLKDKEKLKEIHDQCARKTAAQLQAGKNVAFITLGDPGIYSTCLYIHKRITRLGFETVLIPGVPSFCAAAAKLNVGLVENRQELHIIPASYETEDSLFYPGTKVLMKAGTKMPYIKKLIAENGWKVRMIENCGMQGEMCYDTLEDIPDEASYYSLLLIKEEKE
ncbi:MAG: precorrin-2 C(20)-methyltransferase [Hespellia sp.]|nr:precorrin-2 C(20)-methyltransferase [Hespellia sp.]